MQGTETCQQQRPQAMTKPISLLEDIPGRHGGLREPVYAELTISNAQRGEVEQAQTIMSRAHASRSAP